MDNVIKLREPQQVADTWRRATSLEEAREGIAAGQRVVVSPEILRQLGEPEHSGAAPRSSDLGVEVPAELELAQLAEVSSGLGLVALRVAKFKDGRIFSTAKLLRDRLRFAGEIRAVGEIHPDFIAYLARCGVDSVELPSRHRAEIAIATLGAFKHSYQDNVGYSAVLRAKRPSAAQHPVTVK